MINWPNLVSQLFNGLALGALLALISSGLTIIYGTLGVLNLAHGAMFMLGGYAGLVAYNYTESFIVAVIAGSLFVMVLGVAIERDPAGVSPCFVLGHTTTLRRIRGRCRRGSGRWGVAPTRLPARANSCAGSP